MAGGLLATFAVAVAGFWLVRRRDDNAAALPTKAIAVSAAPAPSSAPLLDPTALFAKAKSNALSWHTDAALIAIDIGPVVGGKVDPSGTLEFVFGKPAGKKLGPGSALQSTEYVVTADAKGLRGTEHAAGKVTSVAEPNCIFEDVLSKATKTGVSTADRWHLRYALNEKSARAVWTLSKDGETEAVRTLDGANCAIIVAYDKPGTKP